MANKTDDTNIENDDIIDGGQNEENTDTIDNVDDTSNSDDASNTDNTETAEQNDTSVEIDSAFAVENTDSMTETAASDVAVMEDIAIFPPGDTLDEENEQDALSKPAKKKHKALKIATIITGAVILCTYIAISVWFMFHFNYKTYINDIDFSFYTLDDVNTYIDSYIEDYSLRLKLRDGQEYEITPDQIKLDIKPNITAGKIIKEQNGFLWPYYMIKRKDYDLYYSASYDKTALEDLLHSFDSLKEANMEKPTDAYVTIDGGKAVIIPETEGNYLDFDKLCCIIDEAIVKGASVLDVSDTDVYEKPELTADSDEIISEQKKLAKILEMIITYEIDQVSWKLTSEDYGDWISNVKGEWKFSEDKVREYVQSIADRYDTYGVPRNFRTHDGRVITLANTWYGWMIDVDGETEELMKLLEAGESVSHTPSFDCYAAVYHDGGDDIGDSYVECDFGQQHVYAYVDGNLVWDSYCVTGSLADNGKYRTPEGVYTILYTKSPAVLIGDDYETPVKYWMPFIGELGIGFHDASWRSSFGGDIYKSSGSHGCVNLPVSAAEQLFNIVYDGMPVICYY